MKSIFKPFALTFVLAASGFAAIPVLAAGPGEGHAGMGMPMHGGAEHHSMDPAKMQARMDKRHASLKAALKITATQEAAWNTYVEAMKPPARLAAKPTEWADIAKLPTPERIDKMKALRNQRMAEMSAMMDKHGEAAKTLYAALTPEQQKVFDSQAMGRHGRDGHMGSLHQGKP